MNNMENEVLEANQSFYRLFAAGDYAGMEMLWAGASDVSVIHPGTPVLHGREAVMISWREILENSGGSQIHCTEPRVYILGDTAYVTCNEDFPEGRLIATNIFVMEDGAWRMVHHQAGPLNESRRVATGINKSIH